MARPPKRQLKQSDSSGDPEAHRWKTETAWTPTPGRKRSASSNGISLMTRTAQMQTEMVQTEVVGLASLFPACLRAARATVASNRIGMPSRQPGWPLEFGPSLAMGSASGELPARPSWLNPIGSTQLAEKQKEGGRPWAPKYKRRTRRVPLGGCSLLAAGSLVANWPCD
jgi:hypothetical protein